METCASSLNNLEAPVDTEKQKETNRKRVHAPFEEATPQKKKKKSEYFPMK